MVDWKDVKTPDLLKAQRFMQACVGTLQHRSGHQEVADLFAEIKEDIDQEVQRRHGGAEEPRTPHSEDGSLDAGDTSQAGPVGYQPRRRKKTAST